MEDESLEKELEKLENEGEKLEDIVLRVLEEIHDRTTISYKELKEKELIINANLVMCFINSQKQEKIRMKQWSGKQTNKNRLWNLVFLIIGGLIGILPWILE